MSPEIALIGLHLLSAHPGTSGPVNNQNWGAYVETVDGWTAGAYRNTLSRTTVYAGHTFRLLGPSGTAAGIALGAGTGYQRHRKIVDCRRQIHFEKRATLGATCSKESGWSNWAIAPLAAPFIEAGPARLWYIPPIGRSAGHVLHISIQWRVK